MVVPTGLEPVLPTWEGGSRHWELFDSRPVIVLCGPRSRCLLKGAVLGRENSHLWRNPIIENLTTSLSREIDRLKKEIGQRYLPTGIFEGRSEKASEGLWASERCRQDGTETEKTAEKGEKNRSSKLEFRVESALQPIHDQ